MIDPFHWNRLSQLHPTEICNRTEAIYNPTREGFVLPVYTLRYLILPKEKKILKMGWNDKPVEEELRPYFYLMVLVYLTEAQDIKPTHIWVSEKDLKGGSTFFRGPHRLEVEELVTLFGKNPEVFLKTGKKLGGSQILYGDNQEQTPADSVVIFFKPRVMRLMTGHETIMSTECERMYKGDYLVLSRKVARQPADHARRDWGMQPASERGA